MHSPAPQAGLRQVEAARYALLRRLAAAMRHQMLVHLQPIDMLTHVIERRLRAGQPDLDRVGSDMGKVQDFARSAVSANLDVVSWLAPEPGQGVALDAGIDECVALLRGHFSFRGFHLRQEPGSTQAVPRAALRTLLTAALFALTDDAHSPAEVVVHAQGASVQLRLVPADGDPALPARPPYRLLAWDEVEALAAAEDVALTRGAGTARLQLRGAA